MFLVFLVEAWAPCSIPAPSLLSTALLRRGRWFLFYFNFFLPGGEARLPDTRGDGRTVGMVLSPKVNPVKVLEPV